MNCFAILRDANVGMFHSPKIPEGSPPRNVVHCYDEKVNPILSQLYVNFCAWSIFSTHAKTEGQNLIYEKPGDPAELVFEKVSQSSCDEGKAPCATVDALSLLFKCSQFRVISLRGITFRRDIEIFMPRLGGAYCFRPVRSQRKSSCPFATEIS